MKRMIFATIGWKSLQKDYISRDMQTFHLQKLYTFLQQDISGYSFEEAIIHYGFISHAAMQSRIAAYMQTETFENAEYFFFLASKAKATSDKLWIANPHKQPQQGQEIQLDCVLVAVMSGCTSDAIDMLDKTRMALEQEQKQSNKSRRDHQQDEQRKEQISLEIDVYKNLMQNNDEQVRQLLPKLEAVHYDVLFIQAVQAFLEQNSELFLEMLAQHMKEFRKNPYAGELNHFVLLMEALYQKHNRLELLDLADAPAAMLNLPECDPTLVEEKTGIVLPLFEVDEILKVIDKNKIGPKFKQY